MDLEDIRTRCIEVHKAIKAMRNLDLSDPSIFTTLPFPSILKMPSQRFKGGDINEFEYMGRSLFHELQRRIRAKGFQEGQESLYLYGPSGAGKSHLLAALAYSLIQEGYRVFYIPDCAHLLLDPEATFWMALNFAFCDTTNLETLVNRNNVKSMINFMSDCHDLYFIVDQVNALDSEENDNCRGKKEQVVTWLDALRYKDRYIFSASPNEASNREADRKQSGISLFRVFGGMNKVC